MRKATWVLMAVGCLFWASADVGGQFGGFGGQPGGGKKKGDFGGVPASGGGAAANLVQRWEYRVETPWSLTGDQKFSMTEGLNKLGNEGWELVAIESSSQKAGNPPSNYIFRRPTTKALIEPKPAVEPKLKEKPEARSEVRIYLLKHADPQEAAALLNDVLRVSRQDPMRIAADSRTNQIIVNGPVPAHVEIEALLQRLDVPTVEGKGPAPGGNPFGGSSKKKGFGPPK